MDEAFILMDFLFIQVPLLPGQMHEALMKLHQALVYPQIFQILLHFYAPSPVPLTGQRVGEWR